MNTQSTGASAPKNAALALVKEAQGNQVAVINGLRCQLVQAHMDLHDIGGKDQPQESLQTLLNAFPGGVPYTLLKTVFEEADLTAARDTLKKTGTIQQTGKRGDDIVLKLVPSAIAAADEVTLTATTPTPTTPSATASGETK